DRAGCVGDGAAGGGSGAAPRGRRTTGGRHGAPATGRVLPPASPAVRGGLGVHGNARAPPDGRRGAGRTGGGAGRGLSARTLTGTAPGARWHTGRGSGAAAVAGAASSTIRRWRGRG